MDEMAVEVTAVLLVLALVWPSALQRTAGSVEREIGVSGWSHPALRAFLLIISPPSYFQVRRDRELDSAATHLRNI